MKIVSLAIFFTSMYLVKSASIEIFASKTNLKEGDNVTITTQITLLPSYQITVIKWLYNSSIDIAVTTTASSIALYPNIKILFGDRISAVYDSSTGYILNLINLRANDSMTLIVKLTSQNGDIYDVANKSLTIDVKALANFSIKVEPGERLAVDNKNTGLIVGVIIGVLVFIAIVIVLVFLFYRHKKTHPSSNPKESLILKPKSEEVYSHYAASTVSAKSDDKKPPTQQYAELGQGGGRDGPKPKHAPSHYSDVKTDDFGFPAKGSMTQSKPNNDIDDELNVDEAIIV